MRLEEYPRPKNDTGIGFRYYRDTRHYGEDDLDFWIPELKAMGVSWLILASDCAHPVPRFFIQELQLNDIEPVIGLHPPKIKPFNQDALRSVMETYAQVGVRYLYAYYEPNMMDQWSWDDWSQPGLVERFMEMLIPCLVRMQEAGLCPSLPPLRLGGHYKDSAFLREMLKVIRSEKGFLFETLVVCVQAPPLWEGQGFYPFERYDRIINGEVGRALPLLVTDSGPLEEEVSAEGVVASAARLQEGLPRHLLNISFGLLASLEGSPEAWYKPDGGRAPAVQALKEFWQRPLQDEPAPPLQKLSAGERRGIYHYLLFPRWEGGISGRYWQAAFNYVKRFLPTCGFDPQEALSAHYVTIIGSSQGVDEAVEARLRASGCRVERISGRDGEEIERILDGLVRAGKRFQNL
ncbi:MAG: hypothetical protein ACE5LG_04480 [Anaerolineae bacterium]